MFRILITKMTRLSVSFYMFILCVSGNREGESHSFKQKRRNVGM